MSNAVQILVNGSARELPAAPPRSLLFALREDLGLTGAKPGCGEGLCGACTVLMDGTPVRACQVKVADAAGHAIRTVEGLAADGALHPVQQAFLETGAFQCGYCTSGMVMSVVALLEQDADPDDARTRSALEENVCRCGTYPRILRAVRRAAELQRARSRGRGAERARSGAGSCSGPRSRRSGARRHWTAARLRPASARGGRGTSAVSRSGTTSRSCPRAWWPSTNPHRTRRPGGRRASVPGSTWASTGSRRRSPARSTPGRTIARRSRCSSPRSSACGSTPCGW